MVIRVRKNPVSEFKFFLRIPAIPYPPATRTLLHAKTRIIFKWIDLVDDEGHSVDLF